MEILKQKRQNNETKMLKHQNEDVQTLKCKKLKYGNMEMSLQGHDILVISDDESTL